MILIDEVLIFPRLKPLLKKRWFSLKKTGYQDCFSIFLAGVLDYIHDGRIIDYFTNLGNDVEKCCTQIKGKLVNETWQLSIQLEHRFYIESVLIHATSSQG